MQQILVRLLSRNFVFWGLILSSSVTQASRILSKLSARESRVSFFGALLLGSDGGSFLMR